MKRSLFFIVIILCSFAALAGNKPILADNTDTTRATADTMQHITLDTLSVSAKAGLPPYQPVAPKIWEIKNTRIALSFNWKEKTADVREWINLHPYFYATDTLELDAKSVMIDSICLVREKGKYSPLNFIYKENKLTIYFKNSYNSRQNVQLYLKYTAMPYMEESGGSAAITHDRGLYFITKNYKIPNKPAEIWTQGETEANSHWMITIDKPNSRFTTQVELTVPDSFTTLGNGALIKQAKAGKGLRTDIWKMDKPIQAYAVMFAIGKFSIVKDKWKNKEVNYYVEPFYAQYAKEMFKHTPDMIDYFSQITGVPFPWNKYSQVVVRDYVSGAMENTSASLFGEFMNQNSREIADKNSEDVVSHELFHQWFGDYATCASWSNITVNESFANYGEQLWREHEYGKASRDELAWNDLQRYIASTYRKDPQLVRYYYDSREEVFDAVSYNKGGAILHYLNSMIGDSAFSKAMQIYLTKNALHSAEADNWRQAVEEATGTDWHWYFKQWYYRAGHPELKVNYQYEDSASQLLVTVEQAQEDGLYELPLKTAVIYGNDKKMVDLNIKKHYDTFIYNYKYGLRPTVIPDCAHVLPGTIKEDKEYSEWLAEYKQGGDYVCKLLAVKQAFKHISDSCAQEIITLALNDSLHSITRNALSELGKIKSEKYRAKWLDRIVFLACKERNIPAKAAAMELLGAWKLTEYKPEMIKAVNDSSYLVAGNALAALSEVDADTAYILARKMLSTQPRSVLKNAVWTCIGNKANNEDIALFEKEAPFEQGVKKFSFCSSLSSYLKNVKSDSSFSRGIDIYKLLIGWESMRQYRIALTGQLFQLASDEKNTTATDSTAMAIDNVQKRTAMLKTALQKIMDDEKDTAAKDEYKKMMKDSFEGE